MSEKLFLSKKLEDVGEQLYYTPEIQLTHRWHGSFDKLPSRSRWEIACDAHRVYRKYVKIFDHKDKYLPATKSTKTEQRT